jgi:hypothetical protein
MSHFKKTHQSAEAVPKEALDSSTERLDTSKAPTHDEWPNHFSVATQYCYKTRSKWRGRGMRRIPTSAPSAEISGHFIALRKSHTPLSCDGKQDDRCSAGRKESGGKTREGA